GRGGVPEAVCLGDRDLTADGVSDVEQSGEPAEPQMHCRKRVRLVAQSVSARAEEQVFRRYVRVSEVRHHVSGVLLLGSDD
ncbi:hypothetical protein Q6281_30765, partial [Klebsiella pneumoniae]|nr:hypothetical protein [Klebsiella pneumoniae]